MVCVIARVNSRRIISCNALRAGHYATKELIPKYLFLCACNVFGYYGRLTLEISKSRGDFKERVWCNG